MFADAIGALLVSLFSGRWIRSLRSRAKRSTEPWREKARVVRELTLPTGFDLSEERCRRVLTTLGEERSTSPAEPGIIEVIGPSNWRTTGTVLRAQLEAAESGGTKVVIAAWPGAQLFDWGESRRLCTEAVKRLAV